MTSCLSTLLSETVVSDWFVSSRVHRLTRSPFWFNRRGEVVLIDPVSEPSFPRSLHPHHRYVVGCFLTAALRHKAGVWSVVCSVSTRCRVWWSVFGLCVVQWMQYIVSQYAVSIAHCTLQLRNAITHIITVLIFDWNGMTDSCIWQV